MLFHQKSGFLLICQMPMCFKRNKLSKKILEEFNFFDEKSWFSEPHIKDG